MWTKKYFQKIWRWGCLCYLLLFALLCSASPAVYVLFFGPPSSAQAAETTPSATSPLHEKTVVTLPSASISPREIKLDADVSIFIQNRIDRGFDTASAQIRDHFTFLLTIIGIVNAILLSVFSIFTFLQVKSAEKDAEKAHACTEEAEKYLNDIKTLKKKALEEFEIEDKRKPCRGEEGKRILTNIQNEKKALEFEKESEGLQNSDLSPTLISSHEPDYTKNAEVQKNQNFKKNEQVEYQSTALSEETWPIRPTHDKEVDDARFNQGFKLYSEDKKEEAIRIWDELAKKGHLPAQWNLAICYKNGDGVEPDSKKFIYWYTQAANQGYEPAQCSLAFCYENGYGVPPDQAKSVEWYIKAAEQGYAPAQWNLAFCYEYGKGVKKDIKKAVELYTQAADKGYAPAQWSLGFCYEYGNEKGVKKDIEKAVELYTQAAEQGLALAQWSLAHCYEIGNGVDQDIQKAVTWYTQAVGQGHAPAQASLALCYETGNGVKKNLQKAVELYTQAAEQGYAPAQWNLAFCYEYGKGVKEDIKKAVELYTQAADKGYAPAQWSLAHCYETGNGVDQDIQKAVTWYTQAAEQGYARAQWSLALCYEKGDGVDKNLQKAIYLYMKAAKQHLPSALSKLVELYLRGEGVPKNHQEAYKCLLLYQAATGDITTYAKTLEALEEELSRKEIHDAQQKATSLFEGNSVKKDTQ